MRITPLDVRKQEFRKAMRGLDAEEVYAFLSTVADEYEAVLNDNKALRERLLELDDKVQEYRSLEKTLRNTLLTAERVTVEAKDNARREAMIIVKEAQMEAEKALRDIKTESTKLRQQIQQLRAQRDAYLAKMKVVTESHLSFVDSTQSDFQVEDRALAELSIPEPKTYTQYTTEPSTQPRRENQNLFDGPGSGPAVDESSAQADAPVSSVSQDVNTPPQSRRSGGGHGPNHASAEMDPVPAATTVPEGPGVGPDESSQGVADVTSIIDRIAQAQREATSASGDFDPSITPPPTIEATTSLGSPSPAADSERDSSSPTATATADKPVPGMSGVTPPSGTDITGEWNIDKIRRDILGRGPAEND